MNRAVTLVCQACGHVAGPLRASPRPFVCPRAGSDGADHLLAPEIVLTRSHWPDGDEPAPFVRYRSLLFVHQAALELGLGDEGYLALASRLDAAVARIDGHGFVRTPLARAPGLEARTGGPTFVKDETHDVSGSHKGRHLFGVALYLDVLREAGLEPSPSPRLAIASCGNAALAAAVVARAADRPLDVHVPPDASPAVLARLADLGARVAICPRGEGELGDPCVRAFRDEVRAGAVPFGCQGTDDGLALDGGRTLAFEIVDALRVEGPMDRLFIQVGGGALASSIARGLDEARRLGALDRLPRLHLVQTERVAPVRAAYDRLLAAVKDDHPGRPLPEGGDALADALRTEPWRRSVEAVLRAAALNRSLLWSPWPDPRPSVAHGILDDDTYDGLAILRAMLETGGSPVTVDEETLVEAAKAMQTRAGIDADETGSAGLAGLLAWRRDHAASPNERALVLATGVRR
jgi:threonine synthase